MGQPTPPGDMPLYEGLGPEWNDIVGAFPEAQRAELAPKLKERISSYESQLEGYKGWDDFQKSGITPDHAKTALDLFSTIENNPQQVYDTIGKYLNISPAQAQEVVEEIEENGSDAEIKALKQQIDTLSQIQLAQHQMTQQEQLAAEQDAQLDAEISGIKKKYGDDIPEDEILMRMMHKNMTAEQAYQEYSQRVDDIRSRRPAPMLLGNGGSVPSRAIDPRKLDSKGTKDLVTQMLDHANAERNRS